MSTASPVRTVAEYTGEIVYIYAFDVAYEMPRAAVRQLLGQPVAQFSVDSSKRSPRQLFFYRAQMVRLPPLERIGPFGPLRIERSVKIMPVGAISIMVRVPFRVKHVKELVAFHDLRFANGVTLYDEVRMLASDVVKDLEHCLIRPNKDLPDEEAYTVFCIQAPLVAEDGSQISAEEWLTTHRRQVASILTEEPDPAHLSEQESVENTGRYFSYYDRDLVVVDWDAAMIIDEPRYFDEILYIMELANLQLTELEAYDRILDGTIEHAYRDLGRKHAFWQPTSIQRELREIRVDLARLSDELSNITKFFGDWHLARIYQGISARFHLYDWHHTIDEKLKTLDELYQLLQSEKNNRWMLSLEIAVVLLFVIDLVILVMGLPK